MRQTACFNLTFFLSTVRFSVETNPSILPTDSRQRVDGAAERKAAQPKHRRLFNQSQWQARWVMAGSLQCQWTGKTKQPTFRMESFRNLKHVCWNQTDRAEEINQTYRMPRTQKVIGSQLRSKSRAVGITAKMWWLNCSTFPASYRNGMIAKRSAKGADFSRRHVVSSAKG